MCYYVTSLPNTETGNITQPRKGEEPKYFTILRNTHYACAVIVYFVPLLTI